MKKVLFVGNFLSKHKGSIGPTEKLAVSLSGDFKIIRASTLKSQPLRLADIAFKTLTASYSFIAIDVYSTKAFAFAEVATTIAAFRKKKTVLVLHGGALPELFAKQPERVKKVFARAWKIVSPSSYLQDFFAKNGFTVEVIPNSVNTDIFTFDRSKVKPFSLLWVRSFKHIYNPQIPIKVIALLKDTFPKISLTMVGHDDGLMDECKALARQLDVTERIEFVGRVDNQQLPAYYNTHSVYLNTTNYESFGIAVVEAAMCGIPVISSNVGEIPYMWDNGENITTVNTITPEDFASAVEKLLQNPDYASQQAENALKITQKFSWVEIKKQWLKLFQ